jgi:hypothetical protein
MIANNLIDFYIDKEECVIRFWLDNAKKYYRYYTTKFKQCYKNVFLNKFIYL